MTPQRLAVWGDPIAHSKSPQLHAAAYGALGLDWEYTRRRVDDAGFDTALAALDESWRGLSLTMPLKERAHRASVTRDRYADLTGAVNTLLLTDGILGFNTDVGGIVDALGEQDLLSIEDVRILGAGATASSALVACVEAGARTVDIRARRPERAAELLSLGRRLGVSITVSTFDADAADVGLTVATLPGGSVLEEATAARLSGSGGALFDVAYSPWPSALASVWSGGPAVSGEGMLLRQAVRQIRIFLHGDQSVPLPAEGVVIAAMEAALQAPDVTRHDPV